MAEVTVRDARVDDARAIGEVWATALPYLVRSSARAAVDIQEDATLDRRRSVGVLDGEVVGTGTARRVADDEVYLSVEVRPDRGSRGVGAALLRTVVSAFPDATSLTAVSSDDPIAMAFGIRHGFLPDGEHLISMVAPGSVAKAGRAPEGLRAVTCDNLPDVQILIDTHNAAANDDPSGLSRQYTWETFHADWWNSPDNAPDLSWALLDDVGGTPVVAAFTSMQVDRTRGRAWSAMTATHPSYRGRGMAGWVKRRALNGLAKAGFAEAWTGNDATNAPMLTVNEALGYRPAATSIRLLRRLPR